MMTGWGAVSNRRHTTRAQRRRKRGRRVAVLAVIATMGTSGCQQTSTATIADARAAYRAAGVSCTLEQESGVLLGALEWWECADNTGGVALYKSAKAREMWADAQEMVPAYSVARGNWVLFGRDRDELRRVADEMPG